MNFGIPGIRHLLEQSKGTRSSGMTSLQWLFGLCLTGLITSIHYKAPGWVIGMLAFFSVLAFLLFCGIYLCSFLKNPDFLRSERFTLQKMAIERGLYGDNITGTVNPETVSQERLLPGTSEQKGKTEK